jgi:hypothetical protein
VHGVAEERYQKRSGCGGDGAGVRAALGIDLLRDGSVPGLDLLEGQRAELASLESGQDVELDQVLVEGDGGWVICAVASARASSGSS